ncbi:DNA replication/repair protein RecF [Tropicimonas sp. IMCC34011]|uniref:DNA replication/repair protein RecF n=1 Tax=Tropicimonas sp. IMCC34011 TaxID=2248759 RepID=UPI000E273B96|nr:DNA replication/repair protein RecF [Tropicimonas sp. IMCC34011]
MPGLAVTELTLSHFRSHRRMTLEAGPRPVAIFGPNGAGKTNLIEAVSLLSPGRGMRRAGADEIARRPEALGWKIGAEMDTPSGRHSVETWSEGGPRSVQVDGKPAPQAALGRIARVVWLVPSMDRLWIEASEGRRRFLDRMVLAFDPGHGEASLAYEKAMRQRNRLLKDQVRDAGWYGALEAQMASAGARIASARRSALSRIAAAQEGAVTAFPAADLFVEAEGPEEEDALAEAFARGRPADLHAGRTLIGPHRTDLGATYTAKGVPAAQCSTGEQKALLISLVLAQARAVAEDAGAPPLLLLDEVAAHLDEGRRAALYDEIVRLGAQAWMTGTGPELFEPLEGRAQRLHVTEADGISRVEDVT